MEKKLPKKERFFRIMIIVFFAIIVIIILMLLFGQKTTFEEKKSGGSNEVSQSMHCNADIILDGYYNAPNSTKNSHEIRAIFGDNELHNITYIYSSTYADKQAAIKGESNIHATYNLIWQAKYKEDPFNSTFSIIDNTTKAIVYAEANQIEQNNSQLLLISPSESSNKTLQALKTLYEKKGFECIIKTQ